MDIYDEIPWIDAMCLHSWNEWQIVHVSVNFENSIILLLVWPVSVWDICLCQLIYFLSMHLQDFIVNEYTTTEDNEGIYEESLSFASLAHHQACQTVEKDLIMVKLIYLYLFVT